MTKVERDEFGKCHTRTDNDRDVPFLGLGILGSGWQRQNWFVDSGIEPCVAAGDVSLGVDSSAINEAARFLVSAPVASCVGWEISRGQRGGGIGGTGLVLESTWYEILGTVLLRSF